MFIITYDRLYILPVVNMCHQTPIRLFKHSNVQMFSHTNIHLLGQFYI